jgi:flavin reductase
VRATATLVEPPSLRLAMRRMAASVSIIAAGGAGGRRGMTATAVASLSLDPPAVIVCLHRSSATFAALACERRFSVNLLHAGQVDAAARFSSANVSGEQRFDDAWRDADGGIPVLHDANAVVLCDLEHQLAFGTHVVIIGRVTRVLLDGDVERLPLLYFDGGYRTVLPGGRE